VSRRERTTARGLRPKLALLIVLGACCVSAGCSSASSGEAGGPTVGPHSASKPFRFFAPTSFWNTPTAAGAPLDPRSTRLIGALDAEVTRELELKTGPWINTTSYSVPIYTVAAKTPTVRVRPNHRLTPEALRSAWSAVPLPARSQPAAGSDRQLVVWQPSSDRLWEFWRLARGPHGWQASWGGAIRRVSSNPGVYSSAAWPGAKPFWGASASSLSIAGGLITLEDLQRGRIDHALSLALPEVRRGFYAAPARRTDGTASSPLSLPEGAHLRLDPKLKLASLHLPPLTLMIAEAAQRYGIFIRDKTANVAFYAQDPPPDRKNPYAGPQGYFEGQYPSQLLASFPWSDLQLLKMKLHRLES
jgi:hypothetical protein